MLFCAGIRSFRTHPHTVRSHVPYDSLVPCRSQLRAALGSDMRSASGSPATASTATASVCTRLELMVWVAVCAEDRRQPKTAYHHANHVVDTIKNIVFIDTYV